MIVKDIRREAIDFLKNYHMYYQDINMDEHVRIFINEMNQGLTGAKSSLQMIPTYIEVPDELPIEDRVIAIDAGGTHCRVALISFDRNRQPTVQFFEKLNMPGIKAEVSKEVFFQTLVRYVENIVDQSEKIGFCFSFPTEIFPNKDGRLLGFSKEIRAPEVIGEVIGENLLLALKKSGHQEHKRIVLLNDTVATLLAGKIFSHNRSYDSYIGFVLGTGSNCCYIESNKNIFKKPDLNPGKSQIINIESGAYNKCPSGKIDNLFDQTTNTPGKYIYEKMFSGAYFGPFCLKTLQIAAKDGLLSPSTSQKILNLTSLETKDVSDFVTNLSDANILRKILHEENDMDLITIYH
ncbi:hexokinase, partial [bacterium]|nr:hexokinase [bacterium]